MPSSARGTTREPWSVSRGERIASAFLDNTDSFDTFTFHTQRQTFWFTQCHPRTPRDPQGRRCDAKDGCQGSSGACWPPPGTALPGLPRLAGSVELLKLPLCKFLCGTLTLGMVPSHRYSASSPLTVPLLRPSASPQELRRTGVEFIVAPYEADAQCAFLCATGYVHAVITEDSDLVPYATPRARTRSSRHLRAVSRQGSPDPGSGLCQR